MKEQFRNQRFNAKSQDLVIKQEKEDVLQLEEFAKKLNGEVKQ